MSMGGRWKIALVGAGLALGMGGCDLSGLADKLAADFEAGVKERAAEAMRQAQAKIGAQGGEVKAYNGAVAVPEGALDGDTMISVSETPPSMIKAELPGVLEPVTPPMAFTPHGTTFNEPVTLSLFHEEGMPTEDLSVLRLDDEQDTSWERVPDSEVMNSDGVSLVSTTHFSVYTVVSCKALPGKLAGVCEDFKSGKISLSELEELAPPEKDAWAGVDIAPPASDGTSSERPPEDEPGERPAELDCGALKDCISAAEECSKDPRSPVCEFAQACERVLVECGDAVGPGMDEPPCAEFAADCKRGIAPACEAHKELCGGTVGPQPIDECGKLDKACQAGDQKACAAFKSKCAGDEPSPCDLLADACAARDQQACDLFDKQCGSVEPPPNECDQLWLDCDDGNTDACTSFEAKCAMTEPDDCNQLWLDCESGDTMACDIYKSGSCGGSSEPDPCYELELACDGGAGDTAACEAYDADCVVIAEPDPCYELELACDGGAGDTAACEEYDAMCGGGSSTDCVTLDEECKSGDQEACKLLEIACSDPSDPPPPDMCVELDMMCKSGDTGACEAFGLAGCSTK